MAPLIALLVGSIAARLVGWLGVGYVNSWTAAVAVGLAAMFVLTGVAHFAPPMRRDLIAIVPPRLPAPGLLVTVTGVLELLGAVGPVASRHPGGGGRVPAAADAGHVPGQHLCGPDAQSAQVDDDAAIPALRHRGRLPGRRHSGRRWRQLAATRTGTRFPATPCSGR